MQPIEQRKPEHFVQLASPTDEQEDWLGIPLGFAIQLAPTQDGKGVEFKAFVAVAWLAEEARTPFPAFHEPSELHYIPAAEVTSEDDEGGELPKELEDAQEVEPNEIVPEPAAHEIQEPLKEPETVQSGPEPEPEAQSEAEPEPSNVAPINPAASLPTAPVPPKRQTKKGKKTRKSKKR